MLDSGESSYDEKPLILTASESKTAALVRPVLGSQNNSPITAP